MVSAVGTQNINPVKMFNALNAFKTSEIKPQEDLIPEIEDKEVKINDSTLLQKQNVDEIKQYAKIAGEENITEEDIKYGVTYGRSVIADYIA